MSGSPFKGLSPFGDSLHDERFFFGRERETELVAANMMASRLTVLYGPSGVGKTSLLRAGVARRLRSLVPAGAPAASPGLAVAVVDDWRDDPIAAIALAADAGTDMPLADALAERTLEVEGELYLILDQIEEYFLYHGRGGPLAAELEELLLRPDLRVHALLGVRDDALADLDAFKPRLPGLFGNVLRLDHLNRVSARSAIDGPLAEYAALGGEEVVAEPALIEAVLDEVAAGRIEQRLTGRGVVPARGAGRRVESPYLQLVLERLWEVELARGSRVLRLETLRELGGAVQIVEQHLERALNQLDDEERLLASRLFGQLVTPSGSKIAHSTEDLARYAGVPEPRLDPVLQTLAAERILRPVPGRTGSGPRFEIFHDVLGQAVLSWQGRYDMARAVAAERASARRRHRRLAAVASAALVALALMSALAVYAFALRQEARDQAVLARAAGASAEREADRALRAEARAKTEAKAAAAAGARALRGEDQARAARATAVREAAAAEAARAKADASAEQARLAEAAAERERDAADAARAASDRDADAARAAKGDALRAADAAAKARARAERDKAAAIAAGRRARGDAYTARAAASSSRNPERALVLALQALPLHSTPELERVLRDSLVDARGLTVLPGGDHVRAVGYGNRGALLLAAGDSGEARIFDAGSGRPLRALRHGAPILAAAIAPDGTTVVTGGRDGAVKVWDGSTGEHLRDLARTGADLAHAGAVTAVALSPDGRYVASGGADQTVRLWETATGALVHAWAQSITIRSVAFSPDGTLLLAVARDGYVFDVESGERVALLDQPGRLTSADFSPTGDRIVTGGEDNRATIWETRTERPLHLLRGHISNVTAVDFSPRGNVVVTGSSDGGARVFDADTGALVDVLVHGGAISRVDFSPDGATIATASRDRTARLWTGENFVLETVLLGHDDGLTDVTFSPDGRTVLTGSEDGSARTWRSAVDPVSPVVARHERGARAAAFGPDGLIASGGVDGFARVWRNGGLIVRLEHPKLVTDVAFALRGRLLTASEDGWARLWSVPQGLPVRAFDHGAPVQSAALDDAGRVLVTAGADGTAAIWDAATGQLLRRLVHGAASLGGAAISPDGSVVATAGSDGVARLWRTSDGKRLHVLKGHGDDLTSAAFSRDGRRLVTASIDADARIWSVATGARLQLLRAHSAVVSDAQFSADGRWVVTGGPVTAGIWEAATGRLWTFVRGHGPRVRSASFDASNRVLTTGDDGTLRMYRCSLCGRTPELAAIARARLAQLGRWLTPAERARYLS